MELNILLLIKFSIKISNKIIISLYYFLIKTFPFIIGLIIAEVSFPLSGAGPKSINVSLLFSLKTLSAISSYMCFR